MTPPSCPLQAVSSQSSAAGRARWGCGAPRRVRAPSCGHGRHPPRTSAGQARTRRRLDRPSSPPALTPQLYNVMPRLGALLQLQRPIMRKVAELRAILRTLLEARRAPAAEEGPAHSYVEALIRQVHVWAGHTPSAAPQRPQRPGPHSRRAPAGPAPRSPASRLGGLSEPQSLHLWNGVSVPASGGGPADAVSPGRSGAQQVPALSFPPSLSSTLSESGLVGLRTPAAS